MKSIRYYHVVCHSFLYSVLYAIPKAERMIKKTNFDDTVEERFSFACKIMDYVRRRSHTKTAVYGERNIPEEDNFILYSNHQGKYDALGILLSLKKPCGVLWEKAQASRILARQICGLLGAVVIDTSTNRSKLRAISEVTENVKNGRNFLIFPEGGYDNNKNDLQSFYSGCFTSSIRSHKPIVPVAIYDSYKAMNSNSLRNVTTQVHFLDPIYYDEYEGMTKRELADMVRSRIETKISEIKSA